MGKLAWFFAGLLIVAPAYAQQVDRMEPLEHGYEGPDTNPPDLQKWFGELTNYMGGSCCGEADGYPAAIDSVPTRPGQTGRGHIIDGSRKDIYAHGHFIKTRAAITGSKDFEFEFEQRTLERWGNPLETAIAFVHVEHGEITKTEAFPNGVYCVVILLPGV